MVEVMLALLLIEALLLVSWWAPYWVHGVPLFSRRIKVPTAALLHFPFERLEDEVADPQWPRLLFRPLAKRSWAFRESFGLHFGWRYPPLMRGQVIIDLRRREIRVVGRCGWAMLFVGVCFIPAAAKAPAGVAVMGVVFAIIYVVQRHRYLAVEAAIRRLMSSAGPRRQIITAQPLGQP